ncbi:ead/Ea22-like family protein [Enterobacter hormaechei]|uniref:ead/Ea22-like family protein n=1 Tax=Enterobacter hormaechei TaxID=158836 RepID=UPI0015E9622D|nr:ead/Ea22-like family protein [Enterobacter hormaechei]QLU81247.1 ead/Ea22-like family protein [Enterobacter hormaechei]
MSNIDKQALRADAVRAGVVKWQYMRATQHSKAYITDDKGSTVVNCTDGDVPANCAGFLTSANPATVLALLDELEAAQKVSAARLGAIDTTHKMFQRERDRAEKAEKRIAELEAREVTLPAQKCCPAEYAGSVLWSETEVWNQAIYECAKAIRSAGIGKGE